MIDSTQLRLATGKKVNSALDNPQSFFQAQALNNRASDLTRLLDGIGQSIRTIEEADKGVTALTALVEQADSIVTSARDELAASDGEARMLGTVDLRNITNLVGTGGIAAADRIVITTTNDAGAQIAESIVIQAGDTAFTLAAKITDQFKDSRAGEVSAQINSTTGYLEIQSKGGRSFKIGDGATTAATTGIGAAGYDALGIGRYFELERRGAATADYVNATVVAGNTVGTISLYESAGNLVDAGDVIVGSTLTDASGTNAVAGILASDGFNFIVNNGTAATGNVTLTTSTSWQDVIDQINQSTAVNTLIRAEFDGLTGSIKITSLSDSVENLQVQLNTGTGVGTRTFDVGFGDPTGNLDPIAPAGGAIIASTVAEQVISFNTSTQVLDGYAKDFNTIRTQINDLVQDAQYRGVNLLNGDDLVTFFNEDNTSSLTTEGSVFTAEGLGLTVASFTSSAAVETMSGLVRDALNTVRTFGASLSNNLSIIQTRRDFTEQTINTLKAGAADLTDADLNEEGANLLALQTAQQLGVTSLSLASQSQQSVLRLF